ncbi:hypothetical protein [Rhizobium giardinii]|uniref:Uncharacterized protein n=1 Tax=Rhizobium giardinii TaxID=56731 RepID=A0A7W8UCF9_9HYPH|nr:hypothetical protein [Rhizobium giardinii]MBB5536842.1 hypothetical protein [Rhizobium giardinii]
MDHDHNISNSPAPRPQDVAVQSEQQAMPQTVQQLATYWLRQPVSVRLPKEDKRHLFSMESWPESVPIKNQDKLRTTKIHNRLREMMGS